MINKINEGDLVKDKNGQLYKVLIIDQEGIAHIKNKSNKVISLLESDLCKNFTK